MDVHAGEAEGIGDGTDGEASGAGVAAEGGEGALDGLPAPSSPFSEREGVEDVHRVYF